MTLTHHKMTSPVIIFSSTYPRVFAENFDKSRDVFQRMANDEDYYDKDRDTSKFLFTFSQNRFGTSSECLKNANIVDFKLIDETYKLTHIVWIEIIG